MRVAIAAIVLVTALALAGWCEPGPTCPMPVPSVSPLSAPELVSSQYLPMIGGF